MESKPVHISLHNVSSFPVTPDLTLNIAKPPLPLCCTWPQRWGIFYVRYQLPALVMSDDQPPGADHGRVPADTGAVTTRTMGWFNLTQTAHCETLWDSPGHPQQHNARPLASSERPPLDSLIFNGLMKTLIFAAWLGHLVNIYSQFTKLENKSRICRFESRCSFYFSEFSGWPAFSDVERASIFGKFIGIKLDVNRLSHSSTCLKHKLLLDNEKAGNGGQIFNATRVIDIRIRSVKQQ